MKLLEQDTDTDSDELQGQTWTSVTRTVQDWREVGVVLHLHTEPPPATMMTDVQHLNIPSSLSIDH